MALRVSRFSLSHRLFFVFGTAAVASANAQSAAIEGVARTEDGTAPVAFALVRLVGADSTKLSVSTAMQSITNASGHYILSGVATGRYRVQLLQIGFAMRLELEYVYGDDARGTVRIDFGDVAFAGGTLRMPVGGEIDMASRRRPTKRTQSRLMISYSEFEEVLRR